MAPRRWRSAGSSRMPKVEIRNKLLLGEAKVATSDREASLASSVVPGSWDGVEVEVEYGPGACCGAAFNFIHSRWNKRAKIESTPMPMPLPTLPILACATVADAGHICLPRPPLGRQPRKSKHVSRRAAKVRTTKHRGSQKLLNSSSAFGLGQQRNASVICATCRLPFAVCCF